MSMLTSDAYTYIARIMGGTTSQEVLDMAKEALYRGYADWEAKKYWRFLTKDTSNTTSVTSVNAVAGNATISAPSTGAFDFVNINQTVTITSGTATLPPNTTVSSFTRNADGTLASITLSNVVGGSTDANATLTFSAHIPLVVGVNDYNLPLDFLGSYVTISTVNKLTLTYRDQRYWDRNISDPTLTGTPGDYTMYNPQSEATQNFGTKRMKFDVIPDTADTVILRYYRKFNRTGTFVDMPDDMLYPFLDYCSNILLQRKLAVDHPDMAQSLANSATEAMKSKDDTPGDDDDIDTGLKSQYEAGVSRNLWNNGAFDPIRY